MTEPRYTDIDDVPALLPLPQPDEHADHIERSHLFGSALFGSAPSGVIDPVPVVAISGVDVASGPVGSVLAVPMAVDGIRVRWGREEILEQPTPATAQVALFDPSRLWAIGRDLIGQLLTLSWTATKPGVGPVRQVYFLGRITRAVFSPKKAAGVNGALVELTVSSLLTDLANRIPTEAWPDETVAARITRISAYTGNVLTSILVRDYWLTPHLAPVPADQQVSILEHVTNLFRASGPDRLTFLPNTQSARFLERRDLGARTPNQLWWNVAGEGTARDGKGAYIRSRYTGTPITNGLPGNPHYIDGGGISYEDKSLTRDITSRITRVEVNHPDSAGTPAYVKKVETVIVGTTVPNVTGRDEATTGVRTARVESSIAWNAYAATAASDLAYMVAREGAGFATEPLTWRLDGFEYFDQAADLMLVGAEVKHWVFLQRSWFPLYGIRPLFGIIGGEIAYRKGKWVIDFRLLPVSTQDLPNHSLAWDEIDDGSSTYQLEWWDEDNPRGLHESLTYEDMEWVGLGLGMTTTPVNKGWDKVYLP